MTMFINENSAVCFAVPSPTLTSVGWVEVRNPTPTPTQEDAQNSDRFLAIIEKARTIKANKH